MLARKYPQLKKPVRCAERMGLIESIRDYYFHRNLAKEDERMLHLQWKLDGIEEGKEEGREEEKLTIARNLLAEGSTPEFGKKSPGSPSMKSRNYKTEPNPTRIYTD